MIKIITVWVKCPICGWNEITQKKYEALREYDFKNGLEMIDGFCKEMDFNRKSMRVVSSELLGEVQKFIFTIKANVQVENPEINQAELEVRMTVYCDSDLRATGLGGAE